MKAETLSSRFISADLIAAPENSPWLRSLTYDLAFFAFPWVPFLLILLFALDWYGGFDIPRDVSNYRWVVTFLFALNFAHRNYTYVVAYGDSSVFQSRNKFFTLCPLVVFPGMYSLHSLKDPEIDQIILTILSLWNFWHIIMQRYGLMRGYAHRAKHGLEDRRHARLDLSFLWCLVLFTIAVGAVLHLSLLGSYPSVAQPTVDALVPFFLDYPVPIAVVFGLSLGVLGSCWLYQEWQHELPLIHRLPRVSFFISNLSLMILCLVNPILGIVAFGFSHSVEYFAYVHAVQKRKVEKRQYQGVLGNIFWREILLGAALLIGLQVFVYYQDLDRIFLNPVVVNTLLSATGIIHFLYDGIIWKKSKPINTWVI